MNLSDLVLFNFSPVPVLFMLVFLKHPVEFPQKIRINVSEQPFDNIFGEGLDVSFQNFKELVDFVGVTSKAI